MKIELKLLAALSQDLYRVAVAVHDNSPKMADRFILESQKHIQLLTNQPTIPYIKSSLAASLYWLQQESSLRKADRLLMYSFILQSFVQTYSV